MSKKKNVRIVTCPAAEGAYARAGSASALAVRTPGHQIAVRVRQETHIAAGIIEHVPFLRGIIRLFASVFRLFSVFDQSMDLDPQPSVHGSRFSRKLTDLFRTTPQALNVLRNCLVAPAILWLMLVLMPRGIELLLLQLEALPRFATNIVCAVFRVLGLVLAVYMLSGIKLFNRLAMYRGACSKACNARDAYGDKFTQEHATLSSRLTAASDGAFILTVLIIVLLIYPVFRFDSVLLETALRIGTLLATAAITDEIVRPLERAKPGSLGASLRVPYVGLQHLFTREPNAQILEVAVTAVHAACENNLNS